VEINIYNTLGQKIRTLLSERKEPGRYETKWDGKSNRGLQVPSGVYFYRIKTVGFQQTKQMLLLR
jgi:flagellar hook assembly protein FlgD